MAGEKKGKTYEVFIMLALHLLKQQGRLRKDIFWNITPAGMTIEPDFTIGGSSDSPEKVILVTHSGSTKESEKKFWRNVGELVEAKTKLPSVPQVYNIVFDSEVKQDLKIIQAAAFDGQLIVGDTDYGIHIQKWVDENLTGLPSDSKEKFKVVLDYFLSGTGDETFRSAVTQLISAVGSLLKSSRSELNKIWTMERRRTPGRIPAARDTFVRRGLTKAALIGEVPGKNKIQKTFPAWMVRIGLVNPSIGGYRIADPELLWVASSALKNIDLKQLLNIAGTISFHQQLDKLRSLSLIDEFSAYVVKYLPELKRTDGMLKHLLSQYADPATGIIVPADVEPPKTIWLFDFVGALVKAKIGKAQGFGYSQFAKHSQAKRLRIGNMDVGTWCSCFMNQFMNRKQSFRPPREAVAFVAEVLSEQLHDFTAEEIKSTVNKVTDAYIAKEYEATLLTHRGFDPIGGILELQIGRIALMRTRIRGAFAERALTGGGSGATSVLKVKNTLINWQSAHGSHTNDKKKEICGRAVALRYTWNRETEEFMLRSGVKKLILIVDGTWRQEDLNALARAGWDEIYYPDEMEKVAAALV